MTPRVRSGELNLRLQILRFAPAARNANNDADGTWPVAFTTRGRKRDQSDRERITAGAEASAVLSRFLVRATARTRSIETTDRIGNKGRTWKIVGIKDATLGPRAENAIEITAEEIKKSGD